MYFLNYKETNLKFIYSSNLRFIFLKQNILLKNINMLKLPKIELYFIFNKVQDINLLKLSNHIMLLWLLTGYKSQILKMFNKLERGVRYYRFLILNKIVKYNLKFIFIDFVVNTFFNLIDRKSLKQYKNFNEFFFKTNNLELFSNIRLSNNFYTAKVNDNLLLKVFFTKNYRLNINYFLKNLKWVK